MGVERWKARLRAWLIDLVREAIRIERLAEQPRAVRVVPASKPSVPHVNHIHVEPSFEQMQAEALSAQEKYYEPTY